MYSRWHAARAAVGPVWVERAVSSRGLSRAWEAFIKMLIELPSWHISMGQDPSPLPFFSASICLPQSSVSLPHTTACLGIQLHLHIPLSRRSFSLSDLSCQNPSYILPCATKLRDASDKGGNPGTGTQQNNKSGCLFVTDLHTGWNQTAALASHRGCYDVSSLQRHSSGRLFPGHCLGCVSPNLLPEMPSAAWAAYQINIGEKKDAEKDLKLYIQMLWLRFSQSHWMYCLYHLLFSHPFENEPLYPGTINNQLAGVMGGCAFLFRGNLTISEQQKGREAARGLVLDTKGQLAAADDSVYV